jgi:hypothetical protein
MELGNLLPVLINAFFTEYEMREGKLVAFIRKTLYYHTLSEGCGVRIAVIYFTLLFLAIDSGSRPNAFLIPRPLYEANEEIVLIPK